MAACCAAGQPPLPAAASCQPPPPHTAATECRARQVHQPIATARRAEMDRAALAAPRCHSPGPAWILHEHPALARGPRAARRLPSPQRAAAKSVPGLVIAPLSFARILFTPASNLAGWGPPGTWTSLWVPSARVKRTTFPTRRCSLRWLEICSPGTRLTPGPGASLPLREQLDTTAVPCCIPQFERGGYGMGCEAEILNANCVPALVRHCCSMHCTLTL